jgi:hypothetical protein
LAAQTEEDSRFISPLRLLPDYIAEPRVVPPAFTKLAYGSSVPPLAATVEVRRRHGSYHAANAGGAVGRPGKPRLRVRL